MALTIDSEYLYILQSRDFSLKVTKIKMSH